MKLIVNKKEIIANIDHVSLPIKKRKNRIKYLKEDNTEYPQYDIPIRLVCNKKLNYYEKECLSRHITWLLCEKENKE